MSQKATHAQESIAADKPDNLTRVPLAAGTLVYETDGLGKTLVGFEDVGDWDDFQDGLAARGIGRGAIHHYPVLDA